MARLSRRCLHGASLALRSAPDGAYSRHLCRVGCPTATLPTIRHRACRNRRWLAYSRRPRVAWFVGKTLVRSGAPCAGSRLTRTGRCRRQHLSSCGCRLIEAWRISPLARHCSTGGAHHERFQIGALCARAI
jgi:hypothetical protein